MLNILRNTVMATLALLSAVALSGCGGTIQRPDMGLMPPTRNIVDKAVSHTQFAGWSNTALAQVGEFQHPRANGGIEPIEAHNEIIKLWWSCDWQARYQVAGPGQATVNGVVAGGVVGAASTGTSVYAAFNVANPTYFIEGGVGGAIQGAHNTNLQAASSAAGAIGGCTRDFWSLSKAHDPAFMGDDAKKDKYWGTVVETIFAGKSGNSSPALEQVTAPTQP